MKQPKGTQKTKRILAALAGSLLLLQIAVASPTPAAAAGTGTSLTATVVVTPFGDTYTTNVSWGGCGGCGQ